MTTAILQFRAPPTATRSCGLEQLVCAYDAELSARREQLELDRNSFLDKVRDLRALDPHDSTGLAALYGEHLEQIDLLLAQFPYRGEPVHCQQQH
ncbi:MAG: hypothetical protein WD928_13190 [Gammaproteobacteria bacterium]